MEKQVLSIEQMQELIKLDINLSKASMIWYPKMAIDSTGKGYVESHYLTINHIISENFWNTRIGKETIPAFTLQDILEITIGTVPQLWRKDGIPTWHIHDYMMKGHFIGTNLMDVAFKYIKWCKQNSYI